MNQEKKIPTRQSYGEGLLNLGKENKNVVVLDADLSGATKTSIFAKEFPERFFDMGIAEQDMLATAAGISTCGKIPFVSTFAVFAAGRAYDQIRNSICYPKLNVKICATHSGITVGEDGATHQMLEDIGMMRGLPNMTVLSPSDDVQTKWAVKECAKIQGPVYVRLARLGTPVIYEENQTFEIGKMIEFGKGTAATVFATSFLNRALWAVGIHGGNVVGSIANPIWTQMTAANQIAMEAGKNLPYMFTSVFYDNYIWTGLAPLATVMIFSKSKRIKALGVLALPAALFNIGEPLIFGLPIMMNPLMMIPFVLGYMVVAVVAVAALPLILILQVPDAPLPVLVTV